MTAGESTIAMLIAFYMMRDARFTIAERIGLGAVAAFFFVVLWVRQVMPQIITWIGFI